MNDQVHISITMPQMEKIEATGFGTIRFEEFHTGDMEIDIRGPIKVRGELNAEDLIINLNAKAEVDLEGRAQSMNADLAFASQLKAYDLQVHDAIVTVKGASNAKVNVINRLEIDDGVASNVDYRGQPEIIRLNKNQ